MLEKISSSVWDRRSRRVKVAHSHKLLWDFILERERERESERERETEREVSHWASLVIIPSHSVPSSLTLAFLLSWVCEHVSQPFNILRRWWNSCVHLVTVAWCSLHGQELDILDFYMINYSGINDYQVCISYIHIHTIQYMIDIQ